MKRQLWIAAMLGIAFFMGAASEAVAEGKVGVVLMHGKDGGATPKSPIGKLARHLRGDFKVKTPNMPWSRTNGFNGTLEDAFKKIDEAVAQLRKSGATKIIVGGHSMGAATALAYATQKTGLDGVLMIAAGHRPDLYADKNTKAIAKAKAFIAAGKPEEKVKIFDKNQGRKITRNLDADIAISWFDPASLVIMQNAAPKLQPGTPVLFIIGNKDGLHPAGKSLIFEKLPQHPKNAYTVVPGGHKATPVNGKSQIATWLKG